MRPTLLAILLLAAPATGLAMPQPQDTADKPAARPARQRPAPAPEAPYTSPARVKVDGAMKDEAIKKGVEILLKLQEGKDNAEWPYEGVYRVAGTIPWGYRVGGTAIVVSALTEAPGYEDDKP